MDSQEKPLSHGKAPEFAQNAEEEKALNTK
jgi:hypothetical protein